MLINLEYTYGYGDILYNLIVLRNLYPKLIHIESAGVSHDNREIPLVKVGKGENGPIFIAGVHGRESINPIVLTSVIETYARRYYSCGEHLLEQYALFFMPIVNPDGYEIATKGYPSIKNPELRADCQNKYGDSALYKYNARGIDINRNFASASFSENKYSGTANSENETKAFINACSLHRYMGMIDFHSRGRAIFYYRSAMDKEYNKRQYDIACRLSECSGYGLYQEQDENPDNQSGGNTVHYFSEEFGLPAFTIESVEEDAEFPLNVKYQQCVFDELKDIPLKFLKLLISNH